MVAKYLQFVSSAAVVFFPGFSGFLVLLSLLFEACCCCLCCFVAGLVGVVSGLFYAYQNWKIIVLELNFNNSVSNILVLRKEQSYEVVVEDGRLFYKQSGGLLTLQKKVHVLS
ncbi:hypothetical protein P8452_47251 [Trifolium repens]|nr:hypothetical protein P8452_47251 [Trifolium repens]